jgi:hypothetical protein
MKTHILCRAIAPALLLLSAHHAVAGTFTFNPGANNNWNDHNNWDGTPGQFPDDDSDTAIIGGSQMLDPDTQRDPDGFEHHQRRRIHTRC